MAEGRPARSLAGLAAAAMSLACLLGVDARAADVGPAHQAAIDVVNASGKSDPIPLAQIFFRQYAKTSPDDQANGALTIAESLLDGDRDADSRELLGSVLREIGPWSVEANTLDRGETDTSIAKRLYEVVARFPASERVRLFYDLALATQVDRYFDVLAQYDAAFADDTAADAWARSIPRLAAALGDYRARFPASGYATRAAKRLVQLGTWASLQGLSREIVADSNAVCADLPGTREFVVTGEWRFRADILMECAFLDVALGRFDAARSRFDQLVAFEPALSGFSAEVPPFDQELLKKEAPDYVDRVFVTRFLPGEPRRGMFSDPAAVGRFARDLLPANASAGPAAIDRFFERLRTFQNADTTIQLASYRQKANAVAGLDAVQREIANARDQLAAALEGVTEKPLDEILALTLVDREVAGESWFGLRFADTKLTDAEADAILATFATTRGLGLVKPLALRPPIL